MAELPSAAVIRAIRWATAITAGNFDQPTPRRDTIARAVADGYLSGEYRVETTHARTGRPRYSGRFANLAVTVDGRAALADADRMPLKFRRVGGGHLAKTATHAYAIERAGNGYRLTVWTLDRFGYLDEKTDDTEDSFADLKRVATEYEHLGDDYRPHEHGARNRMTEAIVRAYEKEVP